MRGLRWMIALTLFAMRAAAQCTIDQCDPATQTCSPIVINFAYGDYQLTGANSPVLFDISGSGIPHRIGWTAAGTDEAFLWLDINHNGKVDGGAELFGTAMRLKNGRRAPNGFEALKELDDSEDGVIDENDAIWGELLLWRDLNHNAASEPDEISTVAGSGLLRIDLHYHWAGRRDSNGNLFKYEALTSIGNNQGAPRAKPAYDIFFVAVP